MCRHQHQERLTFFCRNQVHEGFFVVVIVFSGSRLMVEGSISVCWKERKDWEWKDLVASVKPSWPEGELR